jgi:hypothetical protein
MMELLGYKREEFLVKNCGNRIAKDEEASAAAFRALQAQHYIRYEDLPLESNTVRNGKLKSSAMSIRKTIAKSCNAISAILPSARDLKGNCDLTLCMMG